MQSITIRILVVASLAGLASLAPVLAQDQTQPQTLSEFAKSVQGRVATARGGGQPNPIPFPFGHFLKPPPPPPVETEDGSPVVAITLPTEIKCQGTMNMGGTTVVVMPDGTHRVGDIVFGAKIVAINSAEVTFIYRTKYFKLPVR